MSSQPLTTQQSKTSPSTEAHPRGLAYFPLALFASVMGYAGTTIAAMRIEPLLQLPPIASYALLAVSTTLFVLYLLIFLYRVFAHLEEVQRDFDHPVRMNFFGAITISFLLLAVAYAEIWPSLSATLWWIGAPLHLLLTLTVLNKLITQTRFEVAHYNPAWFIPIVGNLVVPIQGVQCAPKDLNWLYFSIGLVMGTIYTTIFFYRIFFHNPLPLKLLPTFFILMAPPAVGLIAYVKLTGHVDTFSYILYGFAFFIGLLLLFLVKMFYRIPFFISWWAYLFPSAAITIATVLMFHETGEWIYRYLAYIQMLALLFLVVWFTWKTLALLAAKKLCIKED